MTFLFHKGCYAVQLANTAAELAACQRLRQLCFYGAEGLDRDNFDSNCRHLMMTDSTGAVVATARLFVMKSGADVVKSAAAASYDLSGFTTLDTKLMEVGRFCIAPHVLDADVLRIAWGALTRIVDAEGISVLFGCTSFAGTDPSRYGQAFCRLNARHLGPSHLRPAQKAAKVIPFTCHGRSGSDPMPPLLRTYLAMGGWVSDHAVVDEKMNTLHVFTCLMVADVPPERARALRALAQAAPLS